MRYKSVLYRNNIYKERAYKMNMTDFELVPNVAYGIIAGNRNFDDARYVRRENLPAIGGDWETFYSASQDGDELILRRLRLLSRDIVGLEGNKIRANGDIVVNVLPRQVEMPMVKSWMEEVFGLAHRDREDFLNGLAGYLGHLSPQNQRTICLTGKL